MKSGNKYIKDQQKAKYNGSEPNYINNHVE